MTCRALPSPPRARLGRDVVVLGVIAFFVMVGFGVVVPVLPVYARSFGVDDAGAGREHRHRLRGVECDVVCRRGRQREPGS